MSTIRVRLAYMLIAVVALMSAAVLSHSARAAAGGIDGTAHQPRILAAGVGAMHGRLDFLLAVRDASKVRLRFDGRTYAGKAIEPGALGMQYLIRTPQVFHRGRCYSFTVIASNSFGSTRWAGGAKGDGQTSEYC